MFYLLIENSGPVSVAGAIAAVILGATLILVCCVCWLLIYINPVRSTRRHDTSEVEIFFWVGVVLTIFWPAGAIGFAIALIRVLVKIYRAAMKMKSE